MRIEAEACDGIVVFRLQLPRGVHASALNGLSLSCRARIASYKASRQGSVTRLDSTNCNIYDPYALPRDINLTYFAPCADTRQLPQQRLDSQISHSRADAGQGSSLVVRLISKQRHPPSFRAHHNSFSTPLLGAVGAAAVALRVPLF